MAPIEVATSTMIELLAGPLLDDLMSSESLRLDAGSAITPFHGELIVAFGSTGRCTTNSGAVDRVTGST